MVEKMTLSREQIDFIIEIFSIPQLQVSIPKARLAADTWDTLKSLSAESEPKPGS